jgi:hypothetical protein
MCFSTSNRVAVLPQTLTRGEGGLFLIAPCKYQQAFSLKQSGFEKPLKNKIQ